MALKILLADDSMTAQNMGKKILTDAGYEVVAVSNGAAAIKKIASEHPDLAILDEYMPGYTGSEVCERVKAAAETAKMPVLLTVGKMEPFDQDKANKAHADGVMIKPFEASDLIAAVQSIAQRLLAPTPPPRGLDSTVQLRAPLGSTLEETLRIPPPRAGRGGHEDTIPIPPPRLATANVEDTLRLTAQEIKAFQDASYRDWAQNAEPHLDEEEKAAAAAAKEMPVHSVLETEPEPPAVATGGTEPVVAEPAAMMVESPVEPGNIFSATGSAPALAEHEILASTPVAPMVEPMVSASPASAFYTPHVMEEETQEAAPIFAVESSPSLIEPPASQEEAVTAVPAIVEPVTATVTPTPVAEAAPVFETSAPLTPGPMAVMPEVDLEPTITAPVEVSPTPAQELEINSPPQEHSGPVVAQDPALVTEANDISQFVTKFGSEHAEPVHVGMASDLSDEQLAAIIHPAAELTTPAVDTGEVHEVPLPAQTVEPVTATVVTPAIEAAVAKSPIEEQIGSFEAVEPMETVEPVVAYVPDVEDSQSFPVVREPEPIVAPAAVAETPTPVIAAPVVVEPIPEPAAAVMPEEPPASPVVAVAAESATKTEVEPSPDHVAVVRAVETALAAAAGTVAAGVAHVAPEPMHFEEAAAQEVFTPVHEIAPVQPEEEPHHEPVGDAALAEELAAALSTKETEVAAHAASVESAPAEHTTRGLSDNRLAEAVTRAFDNLKPQLIMEIIKELMK